ALPGTEGPPRRTRVPAAGAQPAPDAGARRARLAPSRLDRAAGDPAGADAHRMDAEPSPIRRTPMTDTALFSAPWDQKLTLLTVAASALLLLGATVAIWVALAMLPPGPGRILILSGGVLSLAALVVGALLAPRGYTVSDDRLTIDRLLGSVEIPLATIQSVEILPAG